MKTQTITERFNSLKQEGVGAIITLTGAVTGQNYTESQVLRAFNNLVPKEEYASREKNAIIRYMMSKMAK